MSTHIPYPIHISRDMATTLEALIAEKGYSQVVVLVDTHTRRWCYPLLADTLPVHHVIEIAPGESHKHIQTCVSLWEQMTELKLDRKSVLINLGGGVIGDMGGFVACTYKRGMAFIQMPTTLLAQVDASVGGKLGVDFHGYKNHIGLFAYPDAVLINPAFLETLPMEEIRSGYAEIIKHCLIADAAAWRRLKLIHFWGEEASTGSFDWAPWIQHSVEIKSQVVEADLHEKGIRKSLNFGHTLGHAVEGYRLESGNPILHGEAVAIGMIMESWISQQRGYLSEVALSEIEGYLTQMYPLPIIPEVAFSEIFLRTQNDKKNIGGHINCTLLEGIGRVRVNEALTEQEIYNALERYNVMSGAHV